MMMSVLWYYRPEQTEMGKQPHIHGEVDLFSLILLWQCVVKKAHDVAMFWATPVVRKAVNVEFYLCRTRS